MTNEEESPGLQATKVKKESCSPKQGERQTDKVCTKQLEEAKMAPELNDIRPSTRSLGSYKATKDKERASL